MPKKIARLILHIISVVVFLLSVTELIHKNYENGIILLIFTIVLNPVILDKILLKLGVGDNNYSYASTIVLFIGGFIFVYIISAIIFNKMNLSEENYTTENFEAILKICVYIYYLAALFLCTNADKKSKYILFGCFYGICIILSFFSDWLDNMIIEMMNMIPDGNMSNETYNSIKEVCLTPIKESILTYIIFDTVMDKNDNNQYIDNDEENTDTKENKIDNKVLSSCNANAYNVDVLDKENGKEKNYLITVKK